MTGQASVLAIVLFFAFVGVTLGLSFYLGRKAKSSSGYFAAHGQIPWFVNGIAFAGDYLSAASFLGICGMIAAWGYDGFLYSIGYLAGWIVALFVVAEPMKRLGKFTFADALDAKFESRGIKIAAGISTLAVSVFYLIPQMVGAGVLVQPLLGLEHWQGVVMVGVVVILIVVTAGMVSTTWVQFLKGSLLVFFSAILTWMILDRGLFTAEGGNNGHVFERIGPLVASEDGSDGLPENYARVPFDEGSPWAETAFVRLHDRQTGRDVIFSQNVDEESGERFLLEAMAVTNHGDSKTVLVRMSDEELAELAKQTEAEAVDDVKPEVRMSLHPVGWLSKLPNGESSTGSIGAVDFFRKLQKSQVILWETKNLEESNGDITSVYFQKPTPGSRVLRPGEEPRFRGIRGDAFIGKLNFVSLMLALFCGTASLPHILIRYYTVKDAAAARKSTIVGIASIGFFYVLTLFIGLGAMTSGAMDVSSSNMAAPLLAKSLSDWLFAAISAIAFTTVLGTVSGLILASAGAVAHDLMSGGLGMEMTDEQQVRVAKFASVFVGAIAIVLGILFRGMNVSYLVGWAFSVAASANLPALVMLLFWRRVTQQGIVAAIIVGMVSSLGWILLSADTFEKVYGIPNSGFTPFTQPGIVTIPLGFLTLIVVSLLTQSQTSRTAS